MKSKSGVLVRRFLFVLKAIISALGMILVHSMNAVLYLHSVIGFSPR